MQGWNGMNYGQAASPQSYGFTLPTGFMGQNQPAGWNGWNGMPGVSSPSMTPPDGTEILGSNPVIPGLSPKNITIPGGASRGWLGIAGLGKNLDTLKGAAGLIGGAFNAFNAYRMGKIAKASFNHQKGILDTNLANQIKAYNFNLDGTLRGRQVVESTSDAVREAERKKWEARDERKRSGG